MMAIGGGKTRNYAALPLMFAGVGPAVAKKDEGEDVPIDAVGGGVRRLASVAV
jgi:hypothetical protein